jgi:putative transposase
MSAQEVYRKHNITQQSFYRWKAKYGGMGVSEVKRLRELERENAQLKKIVGLAGTRHLDAQRRELKKVLSLLKRRRAASYLQNAYVISERRACEVLNLPRSTYRYRHRRDALDAAHQEVIRVAALRLLGLSKDL